MALCDPSSTSNEVATGQVPTVGRMVHYVSHGTPPRADGSQAYTSECRAAIITEVDPGLAGSRGVIALPCVGLCVINPTGMFFRTVADGGSVYHDGSGKTGNPNCPAKSAHGDPFRYCECGWTEDGYRGGTWHWPARVGA